MLGWSVADIWLFATLPVLLVLSGFFSGSETALFGLSETQRMQIRQRTGLAARAVESLLAHQRMLLITILISNMTVNVLYFVISSILLMKSEAGAIGEVLLAIASLMLIVLLGEVMPKLIANSRGTTIALLVAPPLIALHQLIGPLRIVLDKVIVEFGAEVGRERASHETGVRNDSRDGASVSVDDLGLAAENAGALVELEPLGDVIVGVVPGLEVVDFYESFCELALQRRYDRRHRGRIHDQDLAVHARNLGFRQGHAPP